MIDSACVCGSVGAVDTTMTISTQQYVAARWQRLFDTAINSFDQQVLSVLVDRFAYDSGTTIERGFEFIQSHPELMRYEKNQIGRGEFALFVLFPDAEKVVGDLGDIRVLNRIYEIKKIKTQHEAIRFGTNIDLVAVSEFRLVTYGLRRIFRNNRLGFDARVASFESRYNSIMDGSDASIGLAKMVPLYELLRDVLVYFRDIKGGSEVVWLLQPFLLDYPTVEQFGLRVVDELTSAYRQNGVDILIIDANNRFLVNPAFDYHSINQTVRPQLVLH